MFSHRNKGRMTIQEINKKNRLRFEESNEPWFFRHFNFIFGAMFIGAIFLFICQTLLILFVGKEIYEKGAEDVLFCLWNGYKDCKP